MDVVSPETRSRIMAAIRASIQSQSVRSAVFCIVAGFGFVFTNEVCRGVPI